MAGVQFIAGLDLAESFYREVVSSLVEEPHAACLLGEGSDVLGFDTSRSQDHEWGPRMQILVAPHHRDVVSRRIARGLPPTFRGFDTAWFRLANGTVTHHVEVDTVDNWTRKTLGVDPRTGMTTADWLGLPQQRLLNLTAGRVFHDDTGDLTHVREVLRWYPRDVWYWMMLSAWHLIGNTEPMRGRCVETGDHLGARLLTARLCRLAMELAFLQERRYWPFRKWFGHAFRRLPAAASLERLLDTALSDDHHKAGAAVEALLGTLGDHHNDLAIGSPIPPRRQPFEVGINAAVRPYTVINAHEYIDTLRAHIADPTLRGLIQVGSIDQLTHADDAIATHTNWPALLTANYRAATREEPTSDPLADL